MSDIERLKARFAAEGGTVKKGVTRQRPVHGKSDQSRSGITGTVKETKPLNYSNGKYAGHLVIFVADDEKLYNFMSSRDFAARLILGHRYVLSVNFEVPPYPTGKDSGIKIDGAIKTVPRLAPVARL